MVAQYPYTLKLLKQTEAVFDENTGEWTGGGESWESVSECRDEVNGSGARIITQDGENYAYSAVIYLPKNDKLTIPAGATVQVWDGEIKRLEGRVVRYGTGYFNARIWL